MSQQSDQYQFILGLGPEIARPLNYYTLLGLPLFCSDPSQIKQHAQLMIDRLRKFKGTPQQALAEKIALQIKSSYQTLTNPAAKQQYDAALRTKLSPSVAVPAATLPPALPVNNSQTVLEHERIPALSEVGLQFRPEPPILTVASAPAIGRRPTLTQRITLPWILSGVVSICILLGLGILLWPSTRPETVKKTAEKQTIIPEPETEPVPKVNPAVKPAAPPPSPAKPVRLPRQYAPSERAIILTPTQPIQMQEIDDELELTNTENAKQLILFGDPDWEDYTLTFEAHYESTNEFLPMLHVAFRAPNEFQAMHLPAFYKVPIDFALRWNRAQSHEPFDENSMRFAPFLATDVKSRDWHNFELQVTKTECQYRRNDQLLFKKQIKDCLLRGRVGFYVGIGHGQRIKLRNIRVVSANGQELWSGLPGPPLETKSFHILQDYYGSLDLQPDSIQPLPALKNWERLFNQQDLNDWNQTFTFRRLGEVKGDSWRVKDQKLTCQSPVPPLLYPDRHYQNMILRTRLQIPEGYVNIHFRNFKLQVCYKTTRQGEGNSESHRVKLSQLPERFQRSGPFTPDSFVDLEVIYAIDVIQIKINGEIWQTQKTNPTSALLDYLNISAERSDETRTLQVAIDSLEVHPLPPEFCLLRLSPLDLRIPRLNWVYAQGNYQFESNGTCVQTENGTRHFYRVKDVNLAGIEIENIETEERRTLRNDACFQTIPGSPNFGKKQMVNFLYWGTFENMDHSALNRDHRDFYNKILLTPAQLSAAEITALPSFQYRYRVAKERRNSLLHFQLLLYEQEIKDISTLPGNEQRSLDIIQNINPRLLSRMYFIAQSMALNKRFIAEQAATQNAYIVEMKELIEECQNRNFPSLQAALEQKLTPTWDQGHRYIASFNLFQNNRDNNDRPTKYHLLADGSIYEQPEWRWKYIGDAQFEFYRAEQLVLTIRSWHFDDRYQVVTEKSAPEFAKVSIKYEILWTPANNKK